eukprot:403349519
MLLYATYLLIQVFELNTFLNFDANKSKNTEGQQKCAGRSLQLSLHPSKQQLKQYYSNLPSAYLYTRPCLNSLSIIGKVMDQTKGPTRDEQLIIDIQQIRGNTILPDCDKDSDSKVADEKIPNPSAKPSWNKIKKQVIEVNPKQSQGFQQLKPGSKSKNQVNIGGSQFSRKEPIKKKNDQKCSELDEEEENALSHLFTFVSKLYEMAKYDQPDSDMEVDQIQEKQNQIEYSVQGGVAQPPQYNVASGNRTGSDQIAVSVDRLLSVSNTDKNNFFNQNQNASNKIVGSGAAAVGTVQSSQSQESAQNNQGNQNVQQSKDQGSILQSNQNQLTGNQNQDLALLQSLLENGDQSNLQLLTQLMNQGDPLTQAYLAQLLQQQEEISLKTQLEAIQSQQIQGQPLTAQEVQMLQEAHQQAQLQAGTQITIQDFLTTNGFVVNEQGQVFRQVQDPLNLLKQQQLQQLALQQLQGGLGGAQSDIELAQSLQYLEYLNQQDPSNWTQEQKQQYQMITELVQQQLTNAQINQQFCSINPASLGLDSLQYQALLQQQLLAAGGALPAGFAGAGVTQPLQPFNFQQLQDLLSGTSLQRPPKRGITHSKIAYFIYYKSVEKQQALNSMQAATLDQQELLLQQLQQQSQQQQQQQQQQAVAMFTQAASAGQTQEQLLQQYLMLFQPQQLQGL